MNLKKIKDNISQRSLVLGKGEELDPNETMRDTSIKSVDMSESDITELPEDCFLKCSNLEQVVLPKNLELVRSGAFFACSKLKAIEFPDSLRAIYSLAFAQCKSLTKIEIPSSVTFISSGVFEHCNALESVAINSLDTKINESAFDECPNLKNVQTPLGEVPMEVLKQAVDSYEGIFSWNLLKKFQNPDGTFSMRTIRRQRSRKNSMDSSYPEAID